MVIALAIVATATLSVVARLHSPSGRNWINRMFYRGSHHVGTMRPTDHRWQGDLAPRVVFTNLDSQRIPYTNLAGQWN